jgi:hypothetical protein
MKTLSAGYMVDIQRLKYVRSLFSEEPTVSIRIALDAVYPSLGQLASTGSSMAESADRLARASSYVMQRFIEVLARVAFLDWLRQQFVPKDESREPWNTFAGLSVGDFHSDVASLMDSIALLIILMDGELEERDAARMPVFSWIAIGGCYHKGLSDELRTLADAVNSWWPAVKSVRDHIVHRRHCRIVFSRPQDGFHFQVYDSEDRALLDEPYLSATTGTEIVDLYLYSAWVISEAAYFLDKLGRVLMERFNLPHEMVMRGGRTGDATLFISALKELMRRAQA